MHNERIDKERVRALSLLQNPIEQLWEIYLKEERLSVSTWEGIDEIVEVMIKRVQRMELVIA